MTTIFPITQTTKLIDSQGYPSVEFKRFTDQLLARAGGVSGGTYSQLTDAVSITWDLDQNPVAVVVLGGNRILANPANMVAGLLYRLTVVQDATGGRTLTFGSAFKFSGGIATVVTPAANAVSELVFSCDGTNMKLIAGALDLR